MNRDRVDKDKAVFRFCRYADGNVVGEIIDETGAIVDSKNFGVMSIGEFEWALDFLNREDPKLAGKILPTIELSRN